MTDYAAEVHEALRLAGLVPPAEDVHFLACSTEYRTRMIHAFDGESPTVLSEELEELREEYAIDIDSLKNEIRSLQKDIEQLRAPQQETASQ